MVSRSRGYSLVELLITLTLFATILSGVAGMIYSTSQAQRESRVLAEVDRSANRVLRAFARDVEAILPGKEGVYHSPGFEGTDVDDNGEDTDRLRFTTTSGRFDFRQEWGNLLEVSEPVNRRSDIVEVEYRLVLDEDDDLGIGLHRIERALITSVATDESEPWVSRLLSGVVSRFNLRYADAEGNWEDAWKLEDKEGVLPTLIELVLEIDLVVDRDPSERAELREQEAEDDIRTSGRAMFFRQLRPAAALGEDLSEAAQGGQAPTQGSGSGASGGGGGGGR